MIIDDYQRPAPRAFNSAPDQHYIDYLPSLLQELAQSQLINGRRKLTQFHCISNCLRRPRNFVIAVECSATRGLAKRPWHISVHSCTLLYRTVQTHLETWLALRRGEFDDGDAVPGYVEREFRRYLECGILAHGFARARCAQCGHDFLIAFSCKGRGVCPSCNTRRMVETAAHLTDHVLPDLPVRQWVLAVPKRLRYFLEHDATLQGAALRLFLGAVEQCLRAHSAGAGPTARLGAIAFIHRFGSALNAHLHFHCVAIDGVFAPTATGGAVFHSATAIDRPAIATVQAKLRCRLLASFVRRGLLADAAARAMTQWDHGGGFSVNASVRIEAADRAFARAAAALLRPAAARPGTTARARPRAPCLRSPPIEPRQQWRADRHPARTA